MKAADAFGLKCKLLISFLVDTEEALCSMGAVRETEKWTQSDRNASYES